MFLPAEAVAEGEGGICELALEMLFPQKLSSSYLKHSFLCKRQLTPDLHNKLSYFITYRMPNLLFFISFYYI